MLSRARPRRTMRVARRPGTSSASPAPNFPRQVFQKVHTIILQGDVAGIPLVTVVTTGLLQYVYSIQSQAVTNFATKWNGFDEYRIIKAVVKLTPITSSTGAFLAYFDENDATVPTLALAQAHCKTMFPISNAAMAAFMGGRSRRDSDGSYRFVWRPSDVADLSWLPIASSAVVATFKVYTDAATLGAPVVATTILVLTTQLTVEFRGLA
jgi:hypothetical protein